MNKAEVRGSVEYNITPEDSEDNVKISAVWTIPYFMTLLENEAIQGVHSPPEKFRFATAFNRNEKRVIIAYSSPKKTVFIKSFELKTFIFDESDWKFEEEQTIAKEERRILQAGKWHMPTNFFIKDRKGLGVKDNKIVCFVENESLYLRFEFVITDIKTKKGPYNITAPQLNDVLKDMFHEGTYSDAVMRSADGVEYKIHKAVVASRSEVLRAHFEHSFTESVTNVVESPLESAVLHETLCYIYTERAKVDEMPEKLLAAADYYQLGRLKALCEEALYRRLTVDNAVDTLQLADLHSAHTLTRLTLDYIKRDYEQLKLITKTEGWAKLNSVDLLKRIYE